ncbi:alpha-2-macroglobulin [Bacteroides sp. OttesenSCG-928-N06]|nr:alpha-2-macroglobulin [Bacteroides sp. OttesenSCG-928-N06]
MQKNFIRCIYLFMFCLIPVFMQGQTYEKLWKQLEEAQRKSLPQTAVSVANEIFNKAKAERNTPQMLKAYTARSLQQQQITPDSLYANLQGLEEWVLTASNQADCAVLHAVIADIYAGYAMNNQWQLRQRTDLADEVPADIREWSANLFVSKVLDHSYAALEDSVVLLATSSKDYQPFVELGNSSEYYRHDLYHLLALKAINSLNKILWLDGSERVKQAVPDIFGRLIRVYREQGNGDALILATLDSLNNHSNNASEHLASLDALIADYANREVIAEAYLAKVNALMINNENVKALQTADEAITKYTRYNRIGAIKAMRERILSPSLSVNMDATAYPGADLAMIINHRNLGGFTVEYYKVNLPVTSPLIRNTRNIASKALDKYIKKAGSQYFVLNKTDDYLNKDSVLKLTVPAEGLYLLRVIPDAKAGNVEEKLLSVTRLKMLTRKLPANQFEVVVLDGTTGYPVENADVRLFINKKGDRVEAEALITDATGKVTTSWRDEYRFITAAKGNDKAMLMQDIRRGYYYYTEPGKEKTNVQMQLLTDRSLYRPGQTVYIKGIAYNLESDTANVVEGKSYKLTLSDPNMREIASYNVKTNEFGSFAQQIVLPAAGLNGTYFLSTDIGNATIRVEEYKRPTFDITFEPQTGSYRLGDEVQVTGTVKSYSGVLVQDVPVNYTVTRASRFWWGRYMDSPTLMTSGSVSVNDSRTFSIPVLLQADDKQQANEGFYVYTVAATVTNAAGETQTSETTLAAGTRSLILTINIDDKIDKDKAVKGTFGATNLNGQPVRVEGNYKIYLYTDYKKKVTATTPALSGSFAANSEMELKAFSELPSGAYKLVAESKDEAGRDATAERDVVLFSSNDKCPPVETAIWYHPIETTFDEEHPAAFIFGTSKKDTYILMDVFAGNKQIESKVLRLNNSLMRFEYPYNPAYGDGLNVSFCFVKDGQTHLQDVRIEKAIPNKELKMKWEVFRDKLRPGQQEEWRLTIQDPQGLPANAEMLATLYDASLDKIWKNNQLLRLYYHRSIPSTGWMIYYPGSNRYNFWFSTKEWKYPVLSYDNFWPGANIEQSVMNYSTTRNSGRIRGLSMMSKQASPEASDVMLDEAAVVYEEESTGAGEPLEPATDNLRTNFAETAFFYPQLRTNEAGEIVFAFTMPESLTRWNFRGYAHTKGMLTGMINGEVTTSKEFMLTPNLPRFVRVGDQTSVAAAITNTTGNAVSGTVVFTLFDPVTEKVIATQKQKFSAEAGKSTGVNFSFTATDKYDVLGCRIVADGGNFSDGEQHLLPVLSDKEWITETLPLPIRGNQKREFSMNELFNNHSKTATDKRLTVQYSATPIWYAVQALPSVSLPNDDNAVSWASAFYANSVASHIIKEQPEIEKMFAIWKQSKDDKGTFLSNLEKNQDVKNILLEESPWIMEATNETEQMRRMYTLFDMNNVRNNNITAITKLKELQLNDGSWTWYKGMSGSRSITTYILESLVKLQNMTGLSKDMDVVTMQKAAFNYLHSEALNEYKRISEAEKKGNKFTGISGTALEYLYLIALSGEKVPEANKRAYTYFLNKVDEDLTTQTVKEKAMSAIVLSQAGKDSQANKFMASLKEHLLQTDELGMYFDFNESPYRWDALRIPAHVAVMTAFDVVGNDTQTVEEMKLWLLKQKQTQQWDSPVSTVNAVYALLNQGDKRFNKQGDVVITLQNKSNGNIEQREVSGGYLWEAFTDKKVTDKANKVVVEKKNEGIAWGALYAQYKEDISKVTQHGGELNVDKKLYVEKVNGNNKQLVPVTSQTVLAVGDKVVSRITITLDRAMDFVQLKDQRGACFEPIGALSGYNWNNGLGYYVAVKDGSTNFFFDALGKGVYVLEYSYRVSRTGTYEGGLAIMQSAYAPEYASHSASVKVKVE